MTPTRRRGPVAHFAAAGEAFADLVDQVPEYRWTRPGLGEWDVRSLTGHTARAITTLITSISTPAEHADISSPADYYLAAGAAQSRAELNAAVAARGVEAGRALGEQPAHLVRQWLETACLALDAADLSMTVTTALGGMRLLDYLPTRTFELVSHTLDLSTATAVPVTIPAAALRSTVLLAADVAVETGQGADVLRALTGRARLTDGFSVVP
ncbi:MAG: maleylpyruvate isomerase N-terminal domain-containing protein [Actinomycetales bacterium]